MERFATTTDGLPDAGAALLRSFIPPRSLASQRRDPAPCEVQNQQSTEDRDKEDDPSPRDPSPLPVISQTQEIQETQERNVDERQRKRLRADGSVDPEPEPDPSGNSDGERDADNPDEVNRELAKSLQQSLGQPGERAIKAVSAAVRHHHLKWLDMHRQKSELEEKTRTRTLPRGWKLQHIAIGDHHASHANKIKERQIDAAMDAINELIVAKEEDAERHLNDRCDAINSAVEAHRARVQRIISMNPNRYRYVDVEVTMDEAIEKIAIAALNAEADEDEEFEDRTEKNWPIKRN